MCPVPEAQILLKVKFASVDRNLSTQLGVNLFSTGAANTIGSVSTGQFNPPTIPKVDTGVNSATATLSDALNLFLFRPDLNLGATIKLLESRGLLEVLAEPNVLAQNGKEASFVAGGEFPYPVVQGSTGGGAAAVTIQFREFGVRLNFVPTITPRGSISLRVAPEVSALDFTHGLTVNGFSVPAITLRKLDTSVELNEGQSFAIGGLLDNRVTDSLEKVPFLGDLPILGKFFQSRSRNKENTELLVIVTPELVRPIPQGTPLPQLKYPVPFLDPNTPRGHRRRRLRASASSAPPSAIPIETLLKSLQADIGQGGSVPAASCADGFSFHRPEVSDRGASPRGLETCPPSGSDAGVFRHGLLNGPLGGTAVRGPGEVITLAEAAAERGQLGELFRGSRSPLRPRSNPSPAPAAEWFPPDADFPDPFPGPSRKNGRSSRWRTDTRAGG